MNKTICKKLQKSIEGSVLTKNEFREFYSVDASYYKIIPRIIVIPKNEKDVMNTIKIAKKMRESVTVRGAGTGLVGSALNDGIIIDMKNFNSMKIHEDHIIVGPGILKGNLDKKLEEVQKFFPPNPSIGSFCSVGGMLGNNSSGSRSLKYGSVIDNVVEVTFIDGNGKKIILPRDKKIVKKITEFASKIEKQKFPKVSKNSSGYRIDKIETENSAHKIIVGSEGTLGIITSAKLRIRKKPKKRILFVVEYKAMRDAARNCIKIRDSRPSAIEFVDKNTLNKIKFSFDDKSKCLLFVEYDERVVSSEKKLKSMVTGKIVKKLDSDEEILTWWRYRDSSLHYSLKTTKKETTMPHVIEDAAVPLNNLPNVFSMIRGINKKFNTKSIIYGHAGNGNVHVRLTSKEQKSTIVKKIATEYFHEIIKLNGTITAEHGDGLARSEFIKMQYGSKNYQIFKDIKAFFDPENILNPGKIITEKSTVVKNLK